MAVLDVNRRIDLLVPAPLADGVLARGTELPTMSCTLAGGESTIEAVVRALPGVGLSGPVLDCVVDQVSADELGPDPRSALVELAAPPPNWAMPPTWNWLGWDELDTTLAPGLVDVFDRRIAELRGDSLVPATRAAWTKLGWYDEACAWIERSLEAAGRSAPNSMIQVRHCGISAMIRVDGPDGRTWFKASFPPFRNEAAVTELLAEIAPGATCGVVATDSSNGWLLLDDFAGTTDATDPDTTRRAVDHLVRLQKNMGLHRSSLRTAGCPHRRLGNLAADLRSSLSSDVVADRLGVSEELVSDLLGAVTHAAALIEQAGLPETLVHGDFHPGNVAVTDNGIVLFDWSDAAIANPVIEAATWAWWYEGDERRATELWALFCSGWQREFGVDTSQLRRDDVDVVAGAFHLVSYVRILTALEPTDQPAYVSGLDHFFTLLTSAVPSAHHSIRGPG